jgi:hypothetical protein
MARPGDPGFQYDAFELGVGLGRRMYPFSDEGGKYNLAGGVGLWIDAAANDHHRSGRACRSGRLGHRRLFADATFTPAQKKVRLAWRAISCGSQLRANVATSDDFNW